jgi:hypothetical protein
VLSLAPVIINLSTRWIPATAALPWGKVPPVPIR